MFKKIGKSKFVLSLISAIIRFYVNILFKTCRIELQFSKDSFELLNKQEQVIVCTWHGRLLITPCIFHKFGKFIAVVSSHGDGQILSNIIQSYGHDIARGSSRKDSVKALQTLLKAMKHGMSPALTPDGPKGPRFKVKGNVMTLAKKYNLPTITVCYSATNAKVLSTWDKFIVPIPFRSKIIIGIGKTITPTGENLDLKLENSLNELMYKLDKECNLKIDY